MARDPGRLGCAAESALRSESMAATASRVRRWLLVEQHGPWGRDALQESRLDAAVAAQLAANARAHGVRVVLTRELDADRSAPRTVHLVRADRVDRWVERLTLDDDVDLLELDLAVLANDQPPGLGEVITEPLHLVCTNGRHDPCCADFGRPVVRALRDVDVPVLECSHIGGDRFAANIVCLPTGVYFGRVPPEEAARILADHDAGIVDLDHYRGRSAWSPPLQAAEIFVRRHLDEPRLDALRFGAASTEREEVRVVLHHVDGREARVRLVQERSPAEALTCADLGMSQPRRHRLLSLEVSPPPEP